MRALNESGDQVPYFFAYKLPEEVYSCPGDPAAFRPSPSTRVKAKDNDGYRYLYSDQKSPLALSPNSLAPGGTPGAITRTLQQILGSSAPDTAGWIAYNDEEPTAADETDAGAGGPGFSTNSSAWGHCKGVLAFDLAAQIGFWLIHSFPRWPAEGQTTFPGSENTRLRYAQTFLCASLGDLQTVENIAGMLRGYHEPQIIHSRLPKGAADALPDLAALVAENSRSASVSHPPANRSTDTGELTFQATTGSKRGVPLRLFAKGPRWGKDIWTELVSHRLGVPLDVETWQRITKTDPLAPATDADGDRVSDGYALWIPEPGWYFRESEDHGKWAVGQPDDSPIVAVGDNNRQISQEKRGGGAVVLEEPGLAAALRSMLVLAPGEAGASDPETRAPAPRRSSQSRSRTARARTARPVKT